MADENVATNDQSDETKANESPSQDDVSPSPIEEAKKINEEMRKNLEEIKNERKKIEKLHAEALINGRPMTNQQPIKKTETDKEYKDRIMRGER